MFRSSRDHSSADKKERDQKEDLAYAGAMRANVEGGMTELVQYFSSLERLKEPKRFALLDLIEHVNTLLKSRYFQIDPHTQVGIILNFFKDNADGNPAIKAHRNPGLSH